MNGIKVVTIDGGSSYPTELIDGFIKRHDELPVRELWLVDITEGKVKIRNCWSTCKTNGRKSRGANRHSFVSKS